MDLGALSPTAGDPFGLAVLQAVLLIMLIRALDLWEREPLWAIAAMAAWGATGAVMIAVPANAAIDGALSPGLEATFGAAISAPLAEELAKGFALVLALLLAKWAAGRIRGVEFDGPIDGMVYGAAIGIGFAFVENNIYFLNTAAFEHNIGAGFANLEDREGFFNLGTLGHAIYTGTFGAGLGLATWSVTRAGKIGWALGGLGVAMFLHAFHNGFASVVLVAQYGYDTTSKLLLGGQAEAGLVRDFEQTNESAWKVVQMVDYAIVPVFLGAILLFARYQQRVLRFELAEEANAGVITREEWEVVTGYGRRLKLYWQLLTQTVRERDLEPLRVVRRMHHDLGELALLKWRLRRTGGETTEVERCRHKIAVLRQHVQSGPSPVQAVQPAAPG